MSRVTADRTYDTLVECHYFYPNEVFDDITDVSKDYPDLQLYVDYFHPSNTKKKLVYLDGTVPVTYNGNQYNIPVCIWIHETYPKKPPRCFVCPSPSMVINSESRNVDTTGSIILNCLSNWKIGWSNLSVVLEEMISAFQHETPLFATFPIRAPLLPPQAELIGHPNPVKSHGSWSLAGCSSVENSSTSEDGMSISALTQHTSNAPTSKSSGDNEISNLFKSLQLDGVNMYQSNNRDKDAGVHNQDCADDPAAHPGLVDNCHKLVVSRLPVGVPPNKMRNKLTIYFQRRRNGGGDVLDVKYPAAQPDQAWVIFRHRRDAEQVVKQPDRVITINEQEFLIHVKRFDDMEVPGNVQGEKAEMYKSILSLDDCSFSPTDVLEAVQSCRDLPSALKYLSHDCPICQEQVSVNRMITMTHCSCMFCESCFKKYFSSVIKEKSIMHAVCPLCNHPDVKGGREETMEYFSLLDTQIRYFMDPGIHELFQSKLRDKALQEMPNFRWCAHCSFGLLHEADTLRMDCPSCRKSTCFQCKKPWAPQHEGISCVKFKEWEQLNSPEFQNSKLDQMLSRNKIDCPNCKFRFFLARGGCLHFKCTQCQHEFCGGCAQPFRQGSACKFFADCEAKGLHAHHPRHCLYHLRDWSVTRLRYLLQHYGVSHPLMFSPKGTMGSRLKGICGVIEFKEESSGTVKEEKCGQLAPSKYNGYCMPHYKECLVEVINQNGLDPLVLYDGTELRAELYRWRVPIPDKQLSETSQQYEDRLRQILKERASLTSTTTSGCKKAPPRNPPV